MRTTWRVWWFCLLLLGAAVHVIAPYAAPASATGQASGPADSGSPQTSASAATSLVRVLPVEGVISPASADFLVRGIEEAAEDGAHLVILRMDTPGGLDASMRSIVRTILGSSVPIVTFVAPSGARAASAGAFILYASHIAAMAPASNLGAASPVAVGGGASPGRAPGDRTRDKDAQPATQPPSEGNEGRTSNENDNPNARGRAGEDTSMRKATNDAAAYLRSLAQLRGRNVEFAEKAVLEAQSLSAQEALEKDVIDIVATDIPQLLLQLDQREVTMGGNAVTLQTAQAEIEEVEPGWRTSVLAIVANPQVALILMMVGVYGLFFELTNPGAAIPGVAGLICLVLGLYAFQLLPVNWAGLALIFLGVAMMIGEVFLPSFGALGVGGVAAFIIGGLMTSDLDWPGYSISMPFLIGTAVAMAALIVLTGTLAARAHRRPVVTGEKGMIGMQGTVALSHEGLAYAEVGGERWRISSSQPLAPGDPIRVTGVDGLTLIVEPAPSTDLKQSPE